ncbi:MAG: NYN domain-containing protein [Oscillospiraceae bacterium]
MKRSVIGILAHVDAGKTTLCEAMLYCSGAIRSQGRVDHGDTFLDNFSLERRRGITIFSKQAVLRLRDMKVTLLDTPGHVDFSAETERTLGVLDCAILVISASEGVQSHTMTLWRLLRRRNIPTLIFVNKMDMPGADKGAVLSELSSTLGGTFFDYSSPDLEELSLCDDMLLEAFLKNGTLSRDDIIGAIHAAKAFPCWFGAALRLKGVEEFMDGISEAAPSCPEKTAFGARIFKITHDEQGARITHMKITGGSLKPRDIIKGDGWEEKITQLREYSGAKFSPSEEALPGDVVAISGLTHTAAGMGLGSEPQGGDTVLTPVLTYSVNFPEGCDIHNAVRKFRELEEEDPQLGLLWDERLGLLRVQLMGPVQLEILRDVLLERFGLSVTFGAGQIIYRETISSTVEGVGHYEPLRHYAEVHLILEPGEPGSGVRIVSSCPEDALERNWQRLILTHLAEKQHLGVLTGSPITDIKITLSAGRAHEKHTEGGDFREATYRAVRQGLMQAQSVLLEPWYSFRIELPQENVGRVLGDLQRMGAEFDPPQTLTGCTVISGSAPVSVIGEYPTELAAFTHGLGRFFSLPGGYRPCSNQEEVTARLGYDPEADLENTPDSVFCSHGAGVTVKWRDVPKHMHLESTLAPSHEEELKLQAMRYIERAASDSELMAIFERTYGPIKRDVQNAVRSPRKSFSEPKPRRAAPRPDGREFVLVDGYNIIFAWKDLKKIAEESLDAARARLIERLRNYQGFRQCAVIVVFDAYKVKGNPGSVEHFGDLSVVYTKEAETADVYIERATYDLAKKHFVRVATSDGLEQVIILGHGALRVPASAFEAEVTETEEAIRSLLYK